MADDITVDNGSGTDYDVATDDDGAGNHVQIVKLAQSADGTRTPIDADADGLEVQGSVASGATDSGDPVKVGGRYNATKPTLTDGQRGDVQLGSRGGQEVNLVAHNSVSNYDSFNPHTDANLITPAIKNIAGIFLYNGTNWDKVRGDVTNGLDVDVTRVNGQGAEAAPIAGTPVAIGGRASTALPTDVGADGDAAWAWLNRHGAQVLAHVPHIGLNSDPYNLLHEGAQYTTAQTSTVLVAGGASEKLVVTDIQIQAFGTTAGTCIVYFGTAAFARGTNRTIFDGEFKPSATLAPGYSSKGPFISGANGDDLLVTTVGDVDVTVSCWYYVVV